MRPLLEILEDERTLCQKLESVYRFMTRTDDRETFDILKAQKQRIDGDIQRVRNEMREYVGELLNGGDSR